jgi:hypothetical protein
MKPFKIIISNGEHQYRLGGVISNSSSENTLFRGRDNLFLTGVNNTLADYFLNRKDMMDETAATSIEHIDNPQPSLEDADPIMSPPEDFQDVQVLDIDRNIEATGLDCEERA